MQVISSSNKNSNLKWKIYTIFSFYIPYLIFISIIFNMPLQHFGIKYLYIVFILFGIIGMLLNSLNRHRNINQILIYIYLFSLLIVYIIQLFLYGYKNSMTQSILMYSLFIVYWTIFFNKYTIDEFKIILTKTIPIIYFIALLAFIQYFISPTLFGLLDTSISKGIEWASTLSFGEYRSFFRASSILGSPQVYGLFMAFYIIILYNIQNNISKLGILFLFIAGALSGNKSFFLIMAIFFIYRYLFIHLEHKIKIISIISIVIALSVLIIPTNSLNNIRVFDRITNITAQIEQEKEDSRIDRYVDILLDPNIFVGSGLGSKTDRTNGNIKVAESYIFQIKSEAGIISFLLFLIFVFGSFIFANKELLHDIRILIFVIFLSMIVVHAFNSPIFFIFWGILISSYSNIKNKKGYIINENTN